MGCSLLGGSSHLGNEENNHGDPRSPKDRVVGPLPNCRTPWLINGGLLTTLPRCSLRKNPPFVVALPIGKGGYSSQLC